MRIPVKGIAVVGAVGSLAAAVAVAAPPDSASRAPTRQAAPQSKPVAAPGSRRPPDALGQSKVAALTAAECDALGGDIWIDSTASICKSGAFCRVQGENGATHDHCLTASK